MASVSGTTATTNANAQMLEADADAASNADAPIHAASTGMTHAGSKAGKSQDASGVGGTESGVLSTHAPAHINAGDLVRQLADALLNSGASPLEDTNGAPTLEAPANSDDFNVGSMGEDEMLLHLQAMTATNMQEQVKGTGITLNRAMKDNISANNERLTKLHDQMAKAYKAMHPHHSFWGWVTKIFAVVVSVVAVVAATASAVASGGLLSPMLGIAVVALGASSTALAAQIQGKSYSMAGELGVGFSKMLKTFGVKGTEADNIGNVIAGSIGVASIVGVLGDPSFATMLATGAMTLAHVNADTMAIVASVVGVVCMIASAAVTMGAGGSSEAKLLGSLAKAAGAGVNGVNSVITGVQGIKNAHEARDASDAEADLLVATAQSGRDQAFLENLTERLKKEVTALQESFVQVAKGISNNAESRNDISRNIGSIGA